MTECFSNHPSYRSPVASKRGLNLSLANRARLLAAGLQGRFDYLFIHATMLI
ncbi:hypothetical protein [Legionella beliardensis]|uniref:hypothetical protein n=1 Tax=Legionella beliardensis TaxID=91822 RepID=UPI001358F677|nr:hypothetical protein [Legionella beliardensis]